MPNYTGCMHLTEDSTHIVLALLTRLSVDVTLLPYLKFRSCGVLLCRSLLLMRWRNLQPQISLQSLEVIQDLLRQVVTVSSPEILSGHRAGQQRTNRGFSILYL